MSRLSPLSLTKRKSPASQLTTGGNSFLHKIQLHLVFRLSVVTDWVVEQGINPELALSSNLTCSRNPLTLRPKQRQSKRYKQTGFPERSTHYFSSDTTVLKFRKHHWICLSGECFYSLIGKGRRFPSELVMANMASSASSKFIPQFFLVIGEFSRHRQPLLARSSLW